MIELGNSGLPPAQAVAAAGVAATLAVAGSLSLALLPPAELQERAFLEAADSVRTRIAEYWLEQQRAGHPRLPTSLQQLGPDAVPPDPWTGVADWGAVRDREGGIVGVYSRSGHRVDHPDLLASLAEPRPLLSEASRAVLGISAWQFRWVPPSTASNPAQPQAAFPKATDALLGRWPGQGGSIGRLVLDEPEMLHHRAALGPESAGRGVQPPGPGSGRMTGSPDSMQRDIHLTSAAPWSVFVPMVAALDSVAGSRADNGEPTPIDLPETRDDPQVLADTNEAPMPLSEDPRERRCQITLGRDPRLACEKIKNTIEGDEGYQSCLAKWDEDLRACVHQRPQG